MSDYTIQTGTESGGFLIRAVHGNIGLVGLQHGEDREIEFKVNEILHEGEFELGTFHSHPVTETFSRADVASFLKDEFEQIMGNTGANGSFNFAFKLPTSGKPEGVEEIEALGFEQDDMPAIADYFHFLYYSGKNELTLQNRDFTGFNVDVEVTDEDIPIEELVDRIGIKGTDQLPSGYTSKKVPSAVITAYLDDF